VSLVDVVPLPRRLAALLNSAKPRLADPVERYQFTNVAGTGNDTAELYLYDEVGWHGTTDADFAQALAGVTARNITLHLNSPGGSVIQGIAVANLLRSHPARVTVSVDALAASIASVIMLAGDEIVVQPGAQVMIHKASGLCIGDDDDMEEFRDFLRKQSENIARAYATRAGGDWETWYSLMAAETWYLADEAVKAGLADRVAEYPRDAPAAKPDEDDPDRPEREYEGAAGRWDLSVFRYAGRTEAPDPLAAAPLPPFEPDAEPEFERTVAFVDLAQVRAEVDRAVAAASAGPPAWFTAWAEAHAEPKLPFEPADDETPDGTAGPVDVPAETSESEDEAETPTGETDGDQPDVEPESEPDPEPPADTEEGDWSAAVAHLTAPTDPWAAATATLRGTAGDDRSATRPAYQR
jgi:ATP-dependent protease ClpP protease subunit